MRQQIFVGRENEIQILETALQETLNNLGKIILVSGNPGSGKSTLVRKFLEKHREDCFVAQSECTADDGIHNAYAPFNHAVELIEKQIKAGEKEKRNQPGDKMKRIFKIFGNVAEKGIESNAFAAMGLELIKGVKTHFVDKEEEETRKPDEKQRALEFQLRELAEIKPVILFIDDLQWADKSSIDFIFALGRSLKNVPFPIMLIGTYRPHEVTERNIINQDGSNEVIQHPFTAMLSRLMRINTKDDSEREDTWLIRIDVPSFSDGEIQDLITQKFPQNDFPEDLALSLFNYTKGRALFVSEILDSLKENGGIYADPNGVFHLKSDALDNIPETTTEVIKERLNLLGENLRKIMNYAAVNGEDFYLQVIQKLLGIEDELELVESLKKLSKDKGLIIDNEETLSIDEVFLDIYHFTHTLQHKYIYDQLSNKEKRILHRKVAEAFKNIFGDRMDQYPDIKAQYHKHSKYASGLIDPTTLKFSKKEVDNSQEAKEILENAGFELEKGWEGYNQGTMAECQSHADQALAFLSQIKVLDEEGHQKKSECYTLKITAFDWENRFPESLDTARKMLEEAKLSGIDSLIFDGMFYLAMAYENLFQHEEAMAQYRETMEFANGKEGIGNHVLALIRFGNYLAGQGKPEDAENAFDLAIEIAQRDDNNSMLSYAYSLKASFIGDTGDYRRAVTLYNKAIAIAELVDDQTAIASHYEGIASLYKDFGEYENAHHYYGKSLDLNREYASESSIAHSLNMYGNNYSAMGEFDLAIEYFEQALEINSKFNYLGRIATNLCNLGANHLYRGEKELALDYLQKCLEIDSRFDDVFNTSIDYLYIGQYFHLTGEMGKAHTSFDKAIEGFIKTESNLWLGKAYVLKGNLFLDENKTGEAAAEYFKALEYYHKMNNDFRITQTYFSIGIANYLGGQYYPALTFFRKALARYESSRDYREMMRCMHMAGIIHILLEEYDNAARYLEKAADLFKHEYLSYFSKRMILETSPGTRRILLENYQNLAKMLIEINESYAIQHYSIALTINGHAGTTENEVVLRDSLTKLYARQSLFGQAIEQLELAIPLINDKNSKAIKELELFELREKIKNPTQEMKQARASLLDKYLNEARMYHSQGDYSEALWYYELAMDLASNPVQESFQSDILYNMGDCQTQTGNHDQAIELFNKAAMILRKTGNNEKLGDIFHEMGSISMSPGKYEHALEYFLQATDEFKTQEKWKEAARDYNYAGRCFQEMEKPDKAIVYFTKAIEIAEKHDIQDNLSIYYNNIGASYSFNEQEDKAAEYYLKGFHTARDNGDISNMAFCAGNLGRIYGRMERTEESGDYFRKSWELYQELGAEALSQGYLSDADYYLEQAWEIANENYLDADCKIKTLELQGDVETRQQRRNKAFNYYYKALSLALDKDDPYHQAVNLNSLGEIYRYVPDYQEAYNHYHQALEAAKKAQDQSLIARSYNNIGTILFLAGQKEQALESAKIAVTIAENQNDYGVAGDYLANLGVLYQELDNIPEALVYYKEAGKAYDRCSDDYSRKLAEIYSTLGFLLRNSGQMEEALDYYRKSLDIHVKANNLHSQSTDYYHMGQLQQIMGFYDDAIEYYRQGLSIDEELGNRNEMVDKFNNIGAAYYSKRDYDQAIEYYMKAVEIDEEIYDRAQQSFHQKNIAQAYQAKGDYDMALKHFYQALILDESLDDALSMSDRYSSISYVYQLKEDYENAINSIHQAIEMDELTGDKTRLTGHLNDLGVIYQAMGKYEDALENYKKSLDLLSDSDDVYKKALRMGNIAKSLAALKRNESAGLRFDDAIESFLKINAVEEAADLSRDAGVILGNAEEYAFSEHYFEKSIKLFNQLEKILDVAYAKEKMSDMLYRQNNLEKSMTAISEARNSYLQNLGAEHMRSIESTVKMVNILYASGRLREAYDMLSQEIPVIAGTLGDDHEYTISCREDLKKIEDAL
ncbi:MAG: tetratricopeptide repeat protein [Bacteroidetes bacterium]|nr:tetratricopeptide repeat protein [Bacteroidota bacterium]